jgi:phosphoglycerate-specific signal transduction histidine kinase
MASHQEIFDTAQKRISELQAVEFQLEREVVTIKDKEFDHPLSESDSDRIIDLRSAKATIRSTIDELAFVTVKALDTTDELKRIRNAIAGAIKDLKKTVDRIAKIGMVANKITQVLGGVEKLGKQIEKLNEDEKEVA